MVYLVVKSMRVSADDFPFLRGTGDEQDNTPPQIKPKGIDTPAFIQGHADQKANPDTWPESFNQAQYGAQNTKGK